MVGLLASLPARQQDKCHVGLTTINYYITASGSLITRLVEVDELSRTGVRDDTEATRRDECFFECVNFFECIIGIVIWGM